MASMITSSGHCSLEDGLKFHCVDKNFYAATFVFFIIDCLIVVTLAAIVIRRKGFKK